MKILYIFLICTQLLIGAEESGAKLFFSENPISFDPPIIKKNNITYIPVRPLVDYFNGTMSFSKKDYVYKISLNNQSFIIKPNTTRFKKNDKQNTFKHKAFIYKTRLYAPLHEFLGELNYQVTSQRMIQLIVLRETLQIKPFIYLVTVMLLI